MYKTWRLKPASVSDVLVAGLGSIDKRVHLPFALLGVDVVVDLLAEGAGKVVTVDAHRPTFLQLVVNLRLRQRTARLTNQKAS